MLGRGEVLCCVISFGLVDLWTCWGTFRGQVWDMYGPCLGRHILGNFLTNSWGNLGAK